VSALLSVENLSVAFHGWDEPVEVLSGVSFDVRAGEIVSIVGESGSGKSVASLAIMGLLGDGGRITAGRVVLAGRDITHLPAQTRRNLLGPELAMIFQEPGTSLNPVQRVGDQIAEAMTEHGTPRVEAWRRAIALMDRVGIPAPDLRARDYPHQLSGGMKQRIMIAMALSCRPRLLIADEPTTALDVTIQAQILNLMLDLRDEFDMGIILITHDMGVVAQMADSVAVMYAGEIVERAPATLLFQHPAHPYARLLMRAIPSTRRRQDHLPRIPGLMPAAGRFPEGCRFQPRCPISAAGCLLPSPPLLPAGAGHESRCVRHADIRAGLFERELQE
jgi:oligopeptide/dipeptide ABC transporter ATP-binding protein